MTTHTPGPWLHGKPAPIHDQCPVYAEADGKTVAITYRGEADARLIAAAPDMRDALRLIAELTGNVLRLHLDASASVSAIHRAATSALSKLKA